MKKNLALFLVMSVFSIYSFAQDYNRSITIEDLKMESYPADKDAEAFVMFDLGNCHFEERATEYVVVFERRTRIKIFSEAGAKWAELEIPFYSHGEIYEHIYDLTAVTYNMENGKINATPLDMSNTFEEKINDYWRVRKFAMPDVKSGSIVEYTYKIESSYKFKLPSWKFQRKIPVAYSEYVASMIPFYTYSYILQGASKFDVFESYEDRNSQRIPMGATGKFFSEMVYKCGMRNIPAFEGEEFISSVDDYIMKLDFQLSEIHRMNGTSESIIKTWDQLIEELNDHPDFGKYIKKVEKTASKIIDLKKYTQMSENERMREIVQYVKNNYSWNSSHSKFASKSYSKLMDEKTGNCADLNLFTIGLLNAAGLNAKPVISSTRDHGKIKYDYPFESFFNNVIIMVDLGDKVILTDATQPMLLNDRIPTQCINDKGLIVQEGEIKWIGLECKIPSLRATKYELEFDEQENLKANVSYKMTEYEASRKRRSLGEDVDEIKNNLAVSSFDFDHSSVIIENVTDKNEPYIIKFKQAGSPEKINNKIYINPFLNQTISENPLKEKSRTYDIDMLYPTIKSYQSSITIPEGYTVDYVPEDLSYNNKDIQLLYKTTRDGQKIDVSFQYSFKESVYGPDYYSKLKFYFNEIVKKGTDKIVLVPVRN